MYQKGRAIDNIIVYNIIKSKVIDSTPFLREVLKRYGH